MKLVFEKNEKLEISVTQKEGDESKTFSYVEMIKHLIVAKSLEHAEIIGDFTESEIKSINSMLDHINLEVAEFYSEDNGLDEN